MRPTLQTFALLSLTVTPALGLGVLIACSPPPSVYFATSPGHLRSDVPPDVVVTIDFAEAFHASQPAIAGDFPLVGPEGEVAARYTFDDGMMSIHPESPLPPGVYEVYGVLAPDALGHYQRTLSSVSRLASVTFTVGSQPRLLGIDPDAEDLTLVFSEAIQPETVQVEVEGSPVVGESGPEPHLVRLRHPSLDHLEPEMLHGEVLAASGEPVDVTGSSGVLSPCTMVRIGGGTCSE